MKIVITYGTYDLLHYGHIKLLERAKALGDYLIVGVTADDFDKNRGKINVQQSLMERVDSIRKTGLADKIIIEEYEGQKIDDIKKYHVDIFTVGSDWVGKFDYLKEYCKVVYLPRTEGISSSELRIEKQTLRMAIVADNVISEKFLNESKYVNGLDAKIINEEEIFDVLDEFDAYYIGIEPCKHYEVIKKLLQYKKHILCESPICLDCNQYDELIKLANSNNIALFDGIKTAYSTAYSRLILQAKSGKIGEVLSVDSTCTSLHDFHNNNINYNSSWNSINTWGPIAVLPILQLLGTNYNECNIYSKIIKNKFDAFSKINFVYPNAVASSKVAKLAKSEGELIITGTTGYFYIPSPWWKTDYYEIRFENSNDTIRQFYQLEGEGIRQELVSFVKTIQTDSKISMIDSKISRTICKIMGEFNNNSIIRIDD